MAEGQGNSVAGMLGKLKASKTDQRQAALMCQLAAGIKDGGVFTISMSINQLIKTHLFSAISFESIGCLSVL